MAMRLKLTSQRSHRIEVSWYRRRYKGNFHGQGDIHPDLGNRLFLVSNAAIVVRSAIDGTNFGHAPALVLFQANPQPKPSQTPTRSTSRLARTLSVHSDPAKAKALLY